MKILFPFTILVLLFSGCPRKNSSDDANIITYNCSANALEIASLNKEISNFTTKSGWQIKLFPFSGDDKLYAMIAANQAPDIFYTNNVMRDRLAAEGHLLNLNAISSGDPFLQRLTPEITTRGKSIDGGWYNITNWIFTCGVYFNKQLFDEAGIRYPDTAWTWNDLVVAARTLTRDRNNDGKTDQYGIFIGSHFIEAFEQMNGAHFEHDALFAAIPRASQEVYEKYLALMREGIMPDLRRMQAMGMQAPQMLASGRVAMLVEAVPNTTLIETLNIPWGIAPLPRFDGKTPQYFRSASGGLSVSAKTKNPNAAWQALKWILADASVYQPNPILNDVSFVTAWEKKYPQLAGSGFREVWNLSERFNGGDARYFVRYSSWTMNPILEQLQPMLDQLWARTISVGDVVAALPTINERVRKEIQDALRNENIGKKFRASMERKLREYDSRNTSMQTP